MFSGKFVSVRVDTVDRSGSERLKISGRLVGGRLQFSREITLSVALDCRGDFFNISLGRNNVNAHETFVIVTFVASAFVIALNRPDELAQGACVENKIFSAHFTQTRKDLPSCGSTSTPRCVFKRAARGMLATLALCGILKKIPVETYLFFFPQSPTAILIIVYKYGMYLKVRVSL